ncbi:mannose-1-phosphate guanylyltransferase [Draconibacterium halophilum]|uniref:mannose-1-phosphate guanylyltransferase n=1 Tax=Draconibacterium halophilum TaxID=2706887 RepID=A0A6C0RG08_9BACT|nr:mannose-1-phosphate guanylyltransferase [Draconibacterium halophilum]QIA08011.1 mannose-1-phosphate guanylyltransferase [Draconibacterium halophilum]
MKDLYTLIMAGGSGTRFWPSSKTVKPKQYLNIFGDKSLLQDTIERFATFTKKENIYIVSSATQAKILEEQTPMLPKENLIYEPIGRNTLPCIGLAAMYAERENQDGVMVVSPSDHLIKNNALFEDTVLAAAKIANERDGIVTLGITPTYPATGYGYVKTAEDITGDEKIKQFKVERFVEKPDEATATNYLKQGGFYWNSGLFVFKVSVFLKAVEQFAPDLYADLRKIQADLGNPGYPETLDTIYRAVESISVDYGIMEHAKNIYLVEGNFDWNDLGSWESVYQTDEKDENGNAGKGEAIFLDSNNSYVSTDDGLVAVVGLDDVIVVRDGNTTLVCKRDNAEDIKKIVEQLKAKNKSEYL